MSVETSLMTAEELLQRPDDGMRHELVRGELTTMAAAGSDHGWGSERIARRLGNYAEQHDLGEVFSSETGFLLSRNPDTVRCPDVPFVRKHRFVRQRPFFIGAPDLAIEVISPSDSYTEVRQKVREYLAAGTQLVIVVDPETEIAWMQTATLERKVTIEGSLDGGDVVPGWTLPLRELFG